MKKHQVSLGERELDILQVLWQSGRASVADVHKSLSSQGHDLAYTTVQTMLNRLEEKRLVARDVTDRAHMYRPVLKEREVLGSAIRRLANRFFHGSTEALAAHLVEQNLSPEQIKRLQALINEQRRKERAR